MKIHWFICLALLSLLSSCHSARPLKRESTVEAVATRDQGFSESSLQAHSQDPSKLFDDRKINGALKTLMGDVKFRNLEEAMELIEIDVPRDETGAFRFEGAARGLYSILEGMILIHPDGRIWVAYLHDAQIDYFTNVLEATNRPPKAMLAWAERFQDAKWNYGAARSDG